MQHNPYLMVLSDTIKPFKLTKEIHESKDYKALLLSNYIQFSNGITMIDYARNEKRILSLGNYGVEEYFKSVNGYISMLDMIVCP
ncbi:hypothetical protein [Flagellimonas myxillae]|uniref:hypothetical protein n=1 Tax=Flagellimonas myxillae TaxID=2942214 RepID=UPI00201EE918|nr:hypothetical protein [Muricauda myxillae]MCL6264929.1 hypothetical protein [Muricauda myxillae]